MSLPERKQLRPHGDMHPIFASRLAAALVRSGLKKSCLARRLGYDQAMVSYWLRGGEPRYSTLLRLARILDTTPHHLLGWTERKAPTDGHQDPPQA